MKTTGTSELKQGEKFLLNKREVAAQLGVCERTIERMVSARQLVKIYVRGCVRFRMSEVQQLMNGGTL